jgi:putative membrane protein insertion efficiency factor
MSLSARVLAGFVLGYRYLLSPVLPMACRYSPTCSEYALEALRRFGALEGGWLAARRICRCHPWGAAGVDELPETAHGSPSGVVGRRSRGSPECDRLRQTSAPASGSANAR